MFRKCFKFELNNFKKTKKTKKFTPKKDIKKNGKNTMSDLNGKIIKETRRNPFVHQIEIYNSVEKIKVSFLKCLFFFKKKKILWMK